VASTALAAAAVCEFGVRGDLYLLDEESRSVTLDFDTGLRQFAAAGFEVRDYAPREWVGTATLQYRERLEEVGVLSIRSRLRGRRVEDRPPMPLFIHPGYRSLSGSVSFLSRTIQGVRLDASLSAEGSDYRAPEPIPQLDLLDRRSVSTEVGAEWGRDWTVRFFGAFRGSRYPEQGTFDPEDPFRRDRAVRAGATWTLRSSVVAQLGADFGDLLGGGILAGKVVGRIRPGPRHEPGRETARSVYHVPAAVSECLSDVGPLYDLRAARVCADLVR
jgi:hypothetical protein